MGPFGLMMAGSGGVGVGGLTLFGLALAALSTPGRAVSVAARVTMATACGLEEEVDRGGAALDDAGTLLCANRATATRVAIAMPALSS